jgi:hypothetical protein
MGWQYGHDRCNDKGDTHDLDGSSYSPLFGARLDPNRDLIGRKAEQDQTRRHFERI